MADKFTPYALTALPAAQDRDVNGIYFIRVQNGMEIFAIADTPSKTAVPLKVEGYVDLTSTQNIAGRKIFDVAIGVDGYNDGQTGGYPNVPNKIFIQKHNKGTMFSLYDVGDSGGIFRVFELDFKNLKTPPTSLEVRHLEKSQEVSKQSGKIVGRADNYLGFKKEFEFAQALTLSIGYNAIPFVDDYIPAWDDGQALIQSLQWDIVWDRGAGGALFQTQSLKYTHFSKMDTPIEIRRNPAGVWQFLGNLNAELTIPEHAKLVIW